MLHGASLKITPSWVSVTTIIDIQWDDDTLSADPPTGKWWGDLALLAGTGSNEGEWQWDFTAPSLELWVPVPGGARRLIAVLNQLNFPITTGMTGDGELAAGLTPTSEAVEFTWEGFGMRMSKSYGTHPPFGSLPAGVTQRK